MLADDAAGYYIQHLIQRTVTTGEANKQIGFLMNMSDDAVRQRKSRYRKLFASAGEIFSEYLPYLM